MKNVVITGTSSGFGKLSALTLARKGYKVWATMRQTESKNHEKKEELLAIAKAENLDIVVVDLDVSEQESIDKAISTIIQVSKVPSHFVNSFSVIVQNVSFKSDNSAAEFPNRQPPENPF